MNTDLPTFTPPPPSNFAGLWWYCSCKCAVGRVPFGSFCTVWHGDMLLFHAVSKFFLWHWWHHVLAAGMQWVPSPSLPWTLRRAQMLEQGEFFPRALGSPIFRCQQPVGTTESSQDISSCIFMSFHWENKWAVSWWDTLRGGFSIKSITTVGSGKDFNIALLIWSSNWFLVFLFACLCWFFSGWYRQALINEERQKGKKIQCVCSVFVPHLSGEGC